MSARADLPKTRVEERSPAGWELVFEEQPYRRYLIDGEEVPSVTTVLGCLDKPGLPWWGMRVGAEGIVECIRSCSSATQELAIFADPVKILTTRKMTVNHVRDKAGDRGSAVHEALEQLVGDGVQPNPYSYPEAERGYIHALLAWYLDASPEIEDGEVIVGSKIHGYAGRYDLRASQPERKLVVRADTGQRKLFPAGIYRIDAKTPKGVYGSHLLQLDLYEVGALEAGYSGTDAQYVLRLGKDGTYEAILNTLPLGTALPIVQASRAVKAADAAVKAVKPRKGAKSV